MATPRIDHIAVSLVAKIPDTLPNFNPLAAMALPDTGNGITASYIIDLVNRALLKLFNMYWGQLGKRITEIMPEIIKISQTINIDTGGYVISSPYKDFFKIYSGNLSSGNGFIKLKDESKYALYRGETYDEYTPTSAKPAIIQMNDRLYMFPATQTYGATLQYIRLPLDPETGAFLTQNGSYDSPFTDQWNETISDIGYNIYLQEANMTS